MNNNSLVKNIITRLGIIVLMVVAYQATLIYVGAASVKADHVCGIEPGGEDSSQKMEYAGLVMNMVVQRYDGSTYEALGNIGLVFTGDNNSPPGYWGAELARYQKNSADPHQSSGTIPQTGGHNINMLNCWYTGDGAGVVLGSGHDNDEWVIDCNTSARNGTGPGGAWYTGYGVPDGARAGGTWDNKYIKAVNGTTAIFEIRYLEPPPPKDGWAVFVPKLTDPFFASSSYYNQDCLIGGWAVDTYNNPGLGINPTRSVTMHIYWDGPGVPAQSTTIPAANQPWPGVHDVIAGAYGVEVGGDNSPGHGFFVQPPAAFRDGKTHLAYVYGLSNTGNWGLKGMPVSFKCDSTTITNPEYDPWLQTSNGNVNAWGKINGQNFGATNFGQRPNSTSVSDPLEATYLVMAALQRGDASNANAETGKFCSNNEYILGGKSLGCDFLKRYKFDLTESYVAGNTFGSPLGYVMQNPGSTVSNLLNGTNGETADMMQTKLRAWQADVRNCSSGWIRELRMDSAGLNGSNFGGSGTDTQQFRPSTSSIPSISDYYPTSGVYGANLNSSGGPYCYSSVLITTPSSSTNRFDIDLGTRTFVSGGRVTYWIRPQGSTPGSYNGRNTYIKSNINVNSTSSYTHPNQIPQIAIVSSGNIYIDPDVTNIDASLYSTGKIFTCYRPNTSSGGSTADAIQYYKTNGPLCKNKLTIRGSVMARSGFEFGRTYFANPGTFNSPAEQIYIPGQALALPPLGWNKDNLPHAESVNVRYLDSSEGPRF